MQSTQPKPEGLNQNPSKHKVTEKLSNVEFDPKLEERMSDEPDSMGVDIDGTNPGSNSHPE